MQRWGGGIHSSLVQHEFILRWSSMSPISWAQSEELFCLCSLSTAVKCGRRTHGLDLAVSLKKNHDPSLYMVPRCADLVRKAPPPVAAMMGLFLKDSIDAAWLAKSDSSPRLKLKRCLLK